MVLHLLVQLSTLSFIVRYAKAGGGRYWDYSAEHGPEKWIEDFPHCNGTRQSPVDIVTSKTVYDKNLGNITFENYGKPTGAVNFTAKNNGHSFVIELSGYTNETVPIIKDGGLPGTFKLLAYHFHWGTEGAEHHLNHEGHGCELHMVHMNTKYATLGDAVDKSDGLAVLGILVDVGERNEVFDKFLNLTKYNVIYPQTSSQVETFDLMSLVPSNQSFYRYNGSLTTPKCQESVTWTVFAKSIEVSELQFDELSKLRYLDSNNESRSMRDNDRPVQPLNGRVINSNFMVHGTETKDTTTNNTAIVGATVGAATPGATVGATVGGATPSAIVGASTVGAATPGATVGATVGGATPSAIVGATPSATPSATVGATPSAIVGATPSAIVRATVNATVGAATPGATVGATVGGTTPSAIVGATPSAIVGATVGATVGAIPSAIVGATVGATVNATVSATPSATPSAIFGATVPTTTDDSNAISGNLMLMITSVFLVATSFLEI